MTRKIVLFLFMVLIIQFAIGKDNSSQYKKISGISIKLLDGTIISGNELGNMIYIGKDEIEKRLGKYSFNTEDIWAGYRYEYSNKGIYFIRQNAFDLIDHVEFENKVEINGVKIVSDAEKVMKRLGKTEYIYPDTEEDTFTMGYEGDGIRILFSNDFEERKNMMEVKAIIEGIKPGKYKKPENVSVVLSNSDLVKLFNVNEKNIVVDNLLGKNFEERRVAVIYSNGDSNKKIYRAELSDKVEVNGIRAGMNLNEIREKMAKLKYKNISEDKGQLVYLINGLKYWFYSLYKNGELTNFVIIKASNI